MSEAVRIITEQVRMRVRREGVDLASDGGLAERYVRDEVQRYSERALGGSHPLIADELQAAREVVASLTGFGALQPFLDDPGIEGSCFMYRAWPEAFTRADGPGRPLAGAEGARRPRGELAQSHQGHTRALAEGAGV